MAQRIAITPEELQTLGGEFITSASQIGEIMTKLESQMNALESSWEGAVKLSYFEEYQQRKPSIQEFQEMVDEYQNAQKLTQGIENLTDEQLNALKDQVWNSYVTNFI